MFLILQQIDAFYIVKELGKHTTKFLILNLAIKLKSNTLSCAHTNIQY